MKSYFVLLIGWLFTLLDVTLAQDKKGLIEANESQWKCNNPLYDSEGDVAKVIFGIGGYKPPVYLKDAKISRNLTICSWYNHLRSCCNDETGKQIQAIYDHYKGTMQIRSSRKIRDILNVFDQYKGFDFKKIKYGKNMSESIDIALKEVRMYVFTVAKAIARCGRNFLSWTISLLCLGCQPYFKVNKFLNYDTKELYIGGSWADKLRVNCQPIIDFYETFSNFSARSIGLLNKAVSENQYNPEYNVTDYKTLDLTYNDFANMIRKLTGKNTTYVRQVDSNKKPIMGTIDDKSPPSEDKSIGQKEVDRLKAFLVNAGEAYNRKFNVYFTFNFTRFDQNLKFSEAICNWSPNLNFAMGENCTVCELKNFTNYTTKKLTITIDNTYLNGGERIGQFESTEDIIVEVPDVIIYFDLPYICRNTGIEDTVPNTFWNISNSTNSTNSTHPLYPSFTYFFEVAFAKILYYDHNEPNATIRRNFTRNLLFPPFREMELHIMLRDENFDYIKNYFQNLERNIVKRYRVVKQQVENMITESTARADQMLSVKDPDSASYAGFVDSTTNSPYTDLLLEYYRFMSSEIEVYMNFDLTLNQLHDILRAFNPKEKEKYSFYCRYNKTCSICPGMIDRTDYVEQAQILVLQEKPIPDDHPSRGCFLSSIVWDANCKDPTKCPDYINNNVKAWCIEDGTCIVCYYYGPLSARVGACWMRANFPFIDWSDPFEVPLFKYQSINSMWEDFKDPYDQYRTKDYPYNIATISEWFYKLNGSKLFSVINLQNIIEEDGIKIPDMSNVTHFKFDKNCISIHMCQIWEQNLLLAEGFWPPYFMVYDPQENRSQHIESLTTNNTTVYDPELVKANKPLLTKYFDVLTTERKNPQNWRFTVLDSRQAEEKVTFDPYEWVDVSVGDPLDVYLNVSGVNDDSDVEKYTDFEISFLLKREVNAGASILLAAYILGLALYVLNTL